MSKPVGNFHGWIFSLIFLISRQLFRANGERKSHADASDVCQGDGAILPIALTVDDMNALSHYEQITGGKLWLGLKANVDLQSSCQDYQCDYLLDWVDGTWFTFSSLYRLINADAQSPCMAFRQNKLKKSPCNFNEAFVCQLTCPSESKKP